MDSLQLSKADRGKFLDLAEQAKTIKAEPKIRLMIIRAARRILSNRGIECNLPDE